MEVEPYGPGEGLSFAYGDKYKMRFSGFLQPMVETKNYPKMDKTTNYTRFRMRRMIARLTGTAAKENLSYQIQVDLTGSSDGGGDGTNNNFLMDAWLGWKLHKRVEVIVGQDNSPTDSREMGMVSSSLQMVDRSPIALTFSSVREFGVFFNTNFKIGQNSVLLPSFALTNGDGANVLGKDHGGVKVGGRLDFLPFGKFANGGQFRQTDMERELTPKLVFGVTFSHNQGISDRRGRQSGSILYLDSLGNESLPDYQKIGADFLFKYKGFSVLGEFVKSSSTVPSSIRQRIRNDGSLSSSFLDANGIQNIPSYVKARMILGSGFNIQAGYLFLSGYELNARYTQINADDNSFLNNPTFYNRPEYYSFCASKYLGRNYGAKVQASLTYNKAKAGTTTVLGTPLVGNEISGSLMITISL